jgi:EAL domain-containing protein (putative c-di-GMP-specific phosphodiesterase class I)
VSPARFIALAEESGLIHELGAHMLATACTHLAEWNGNGLGATPVRLTPNCSGVQFEAPDFVERVEGALAETSISPELVFVEVTETSIMRARGSIDDLRALGVRVLVDDFGTGYSSLRYVRDLEVDGLKIDMSFVQGLAAGGSDRAIVETILTLGRQLGLRVIGEGIETDQQLRLLREMGCEIGQGFLFARPMPADEVAELLSGGGDWEVAS